MTGRTPACEDSGIAERLRELQRERMAAIAGCECPPDGSGGTTHRPGCPLEPRPAQMASPTPIAQVIAAVERLRARARRAAQGERYVDRFDELMAEAIAAKVARHRVLP